MTTLLDWFQPLEQCTTLEQITEQWAPLLEEHGVVGSQEDLRYYDAVLSFLGRSTLPANLKFAAVFVCVSEFDVDLRLALGLLDEALDPYRIESSKECPMLDASCIRIPSANPWLLGYVHGRLTQVQAAIRESRERDSWGRRFWNAFLTMSCRWADANGVRLALANGAQAHFNNYRAVAAAAEGVQADFGSAYYASGRSNADYRAILDLLFDAGIVLTDAATAALQAAAASGNTELLEYLIQRGADIHAGNDAALIAAAGSHQLDALEWLLQQGADVHAQGEAALLAAIGSLCSANAESLLAAGADLHAVEEAALRTAFSAMPYELFAGDCQDFVFGRAEMIGVLVNHGATINRIAHDASIRSVAHFSELIAHLLGSDDIPADAKAAIAGIGQGH